ncbi:MAG TPA: AAA family ATPase [Rhodopila sp.]|uniref:AAA family ATPase n=1 Tax=Rhodopila sp. TaxID=2480087 RepID=UPI002BE67F2F|nr:AAA family ATPase [Rhodopila sp.]HVY14489.1 AAA family ATPase [Rhodopila sp.]
MPDGNTRRDFVPPPSEGYQESHPDWRARQQTPSPGKPSESPALRTFLSIQAWADRPIPPPDRLLGDLVTTTTRMFLVGRTGLGKTLLGQAIAYGIASGAGFLHWRSTRAARVLIIDGEMPSELIKARAVDAIRRGASAVQDGNLIIYSRELEDEIFKVWPDFGRLQPLNTEAGHQFVLDLVERLGGVDLIVFDNVMSLIAGDQKDEVPWSETLPLVSALTTKRIGQIWLDHTGHDTGKQYGSATKAWRFDAVGLMSPLEKGETAPGETAFTLSFEAPGKARRRTPDNWAEFETCIIRLADDRWTSETASGRPMGRAKENKLNSQTALFLAEFRRLLAVSGAPYTPPGGCFGCRAVSREALRQKLVEKGWFPDSMLRTASDGIELLRSGYPKENNALTTLKRNGFIDFDRMCVWES